MKQLTKEEMERAATLDPAFRQGMEIDMSAYGGEPEGEVAEGEADVEKDSNAGAAKRPERGRKKSLSKTTSSTGEDSSLVRIYISADYAMKLRILKALKGVSIREAVEKSLDAYLKKNLPSEIKL